MNVKDLEFYQLVCEQKSITKAARLLYMTPQGLSKIMKNIETELEVTLLNRTAAGITLTTAGQYLFEKLPDFLASYDMIRSEIRCIAQKENREINLLSAFGILRLVTPECIIAFQEKHPEIIFHYREYPDRQVEYMFEHGEGNVAFTVGDPGKPYINATFMESFEIKLLVHQSHPLAQRQSVSIQDLKGEKLYIEGPEFNIYHLITGKCREAGFEPNIVFQTNGFSLCHKLVQQNKGISVTVDFIFDDMKQDGLVMVPFHDGIYNWSTYMLTRKETIFNPDIQLFHRHVADWMQNISAGNILR